MANKLYKQDIEQLGGDIDNLHAELCAAIRIRDWDEVHAIMDRINAAKSALKEVKSMMIEQTRTL
jgi:hypothetical protein